MRRSKSPRRRAPSRVVDRYKRAARRVRHALSPQCAPPYLGRAVGEPAQNQAGLKTRKWSQARAQSSRTPPSANPPTPPPPSPTRRAPRRLTVTAPPPPPHARVADEVNTLSSCQSRRQHCAAVAVHPARPAVMPSVYSNAAARRALLHLAAATRRSPHHAAGSGRHTVPKTVSPTTPRGRNGPHRSSTPSSVFVACACHQLPLMTTPARSASTLISHRRSPSVRWVAVPRR